MRIEISGDGLRSELQMMPRRREMFKNATRDDIAFVSNDVMWKVKRLTPVDTGRARATWGIFTPEMVVYISTKNPLNPAESIWRVKDDGFTIEQGTDVAYMEALNSGYSDQAPAMYLDVIAEQAGDMLVTRLFNQVDLL